jgi:hypothetical protein
MKKYLYLIEIHIFLSGRTLPLNVIFQPVGGEPRSKIQFVG